MKKEMKKKARKKALDSLKEEMMGDMGEVMGMPEMMKGKMKVTVMADDAEGMVEGLSKAEQIIKKKAEMGEMEDEYDIEDEFEDGGFKEKSLGKGEAYKRGYEDKDGKYDRKMPEYDSHRDKIKPRGEGKGPLYEAAKKRKKK